MKSYLPVIGWSALILLLSTRATINLPQSWWDLFSPDKLGHAFVYGVQTWLLLKAFQDKAIGKNPVFWALFLSIFYGILMEVLQYTFFPNRFFEVFDIIANIIGSLMGLTIFNKFFKTP